MLLKLLFGPLFGARMEAELDELGFHGDAGNPQPAGGFGLVALGQFDGLPEQFPLGGFQHARMDIGRFAALGRRQQIANVSAQRLAGPRWPARLSLCSAARTWSTLTVYPWASNRALRTAFSSSRTLPGPGMGLEKFHGVGMNGRTGVAEFRSVLAQEIADQRGNVLLALAQRRAA